MNFDIKVGFSRLDVTPPLAIDLLGYYHRRLAGGSDAADMTAYGITCLDSLGVIGKNMHSLGEYALISSLLDCAKFLTLVTLELN